MKPGRKPIGKRAMTSAERQRRFLDKLRDGRGGEVAALKERIRELEDKIAIMQTFGTNDPKMAKKLRLVVAEAKRMRRG